MSKIEWTEETWNPIVGCSIVSPGCTNCYAMKMAARIEAMGGASHYAGTTRKVNGHAVWTGKMALAPERTLLEPLRRKKPTTYFANSMGDLFHEDVPDEWIDRVFGVMQLAPQHTFQVLTKRSQRMRDWTTMRSERPVECLASLYVDCPNLATWLPLDKDRAIQVGMAGWPLPNVWLGVSTEDQHRADERIPDLLATQAAVRFVSAEPLLGAIDFEAIRCPNECHAPDYCNKCDPDGGTATGKFDALQKGIDWIIVGGESGPGARPMHPDWARSIRDQCTTAGVAFFFKQWGQWGEIYDRDKEDPDWRRCDLIMQNTAKGQWLNLAGGQGFHGDRVVRVVPANKRVTGRELDGRTWDEMPSCRT